MSWNNKTSLFVRLTPNAKRTGWQGLWNEKYWRVSVREQAIDNKANIALIKFLSQETGIPTKDIKITHGLTSRQKTIEIIGLNNFVPLIVKEENK